MTTDKPQVAIFLIKQYEKLRKLKCHWYSFFEKFFNWYLNSIDLKFFFFFKTKKKKTAKWSQMIYKKNEMCKDLKSQNYFEDKLSFDALTPPPNQLNVVNGHGLSQ